SAGRLAPAKIDKPKIAEILPFSAGSDYSCHPNRTHSMNHFPLSTFNFPLKKPTLLLIVIG
ncbi:hypothetical protein, partial [uncultured Ruminococcus sp.]|uniref:hypothetical protein n=1 Tax=uncultured Ruminococcus sp. TaxID=165186 RepID=UPI00292E9EA7